MVAEERVIQARVKIDGTRTFGGDRTPAAKDNIHLHQDAARAGAVRHVDELYLQEGGVVMCGTSSKGGYNHRDQSRV